MKLIKQLLIWGLIIALSLGTSSSLARAESNSLSRSEVDSIPSFLDQAMREFMVEEHIPNAVVTIVHNGDILFSQGYGLADIEQQKPVDPSHSLFRIGSTAKVFTWIAVMQLVEEGKLDLDTDIREYIDFYIPSTIHGSNETASPITLAHLMTHTPGFEDYPDQIFRLSPTEMPELDRYVREHLPARIFPPGEVAAYSNYGTALAGYIVERVSGLSFEEYIEKHIFTPLEMNHSTFRQPVPEHLTEQLVQGYRYVENEFKKGEFEYTPVPAGGMSTTATDMALFMLAYLQPEQAEEKRVLKQDTLRSMHLQQFTHHPYLGGWLMALKKVALMGIEPYSMVAGPCYLIQGCISFLSINLDFLSLTAEPIIWYTQPYFKH
ncbi:serine hydrolase domain-containing protein [Caldalkalibacillus mannanilyticus]|uniref:serine hydrolase domain-containing protein n=1 Tax=Caldalkalibacillus mannanilyticus TaxID=1418 RepID=UPI0006884333|nr:serine hydrolase domain-containing protein [Caldalkalibacillus mannanilyticus]